MVDSFQHREDEKRDIPGDKSVGMDEEKENIQALMSPV
jgi:hypothetical protein